MTTVIGERILGAAPALTRAAAIVRASHERCHGFDAMVSPRPYRAARTTGDALAELQRCAGTQFDPAVVHALHTAVAADADAAPRAA